MTIDRALEGLYPFLHRTRRGPAALNAALLESVAQKAAHHLEVVHDFFARQAQAVVDTAASLADVYRRNGRVFTMGNGGSSCDAAHFAVEFQHPVTAGRPALTAIDLTRDVTMLTAVGNDVGFSEVFRRQVIALARAGDALVGLSTSGNSENLVRAFQIAREMQVKTIGLCGMSGGAMARLGLDHCLVVETDSIHRVQECQVAVYHMLWDLVHTLLADDRGALFAAAEAGAPSREDRP